MALLSYMLHDQCNSNKFGPIYPRYTTEGLGSQVMGCSLSKEDLTQGEGGNLIRLEAWEKKEKESVRYAIESEVKYDPWGVYDHKGKVEASPAQDQKEKNVSIVDLRTNHDAIKNARDVKSAVKNSEAQTDSAEGVDFDWDLTDKTDIETQTAPPSRNGYSDEPADAIVQTDQRIVFFGAHHRPLSEKKVMFDLDEAEKMSVKNNWSQTRWEMHDKEVQVLPSDLGTSEGDEWSGWRRKGPDSYNIATQVESFHGAPPAKASGSSRYRQTVSKSSIISSQKQSQPKAKSLHFDHDLDEPMAFVHKSSIAVHKTRLAQNKSEVPLDVAIQTELDHNHLDHMGFNVVPPEESKADILENDPYYFMTVDDHVLEVSRKWYKSVKKLVKHLMEVVYDVPEYQERQDLVIVRAIFVWISENLRYDPAFLEHQLTTLDILRYRAGVCREFVKIFAEMCQIAEIPVKSIEGFAKGQDYKPGTSFGPSSEFHIWVAVFIENSWRLVDPTWGAGEFDESTGEYSALLKEHYFLTDPDDLLMTHFPFVESDPEYSRWQLVEDPITLEEFNSGPHLSPAFFEHGLELVDDIPTPLVVEDSAVLRIKSWEVIRYKYKLFEATEGESESLNNYCTCHLEGEDRTLAVFTLSLPTLGDYYLRIFGTPESELSTEEAAKCEFFASFLISFTRVIPKVEPWPLAAQPWGLTSAYNDLGVTMVIDDPHKWDAYKIVMVGGTKAMFKFVHRNGPIMSAVHMYDYEGKELVEEGDGHGHSTLFFLSTKNPVNRSEVKKRIESGELKTFVTKLEKEDETIFTVYAPPHVGHYKLEIFAAKIPKTRGKLNLPVVATFMVEVKLKTLFAEVVAQGTDLDISAPPSVHKTGHKLASIAETFEDKSDYDGSSRTKSANSIMSNIRGRSLFSLKRSKSASKTDARKNSIFSLESFSSRKVSVVPNSINQEGKY